MSSVPDDDILAAITSGLPGWELQDGALRKRFTFRGFTAAIDFINRMADVANAARHHPDFCNHYNAVDVSVTTHSAGGVTTADLELARGIEAVAEPVPE